MDASQTPIEATREPADALLSHPSHPTLALQADVPCHACGYNLRGLTADRRCPECGTPIRLSLQADRLTVAPAAWLRRALLAAGVTSGGLVVSFVGMVTLAAGSFPSARSADPVTFLWIQLLPWLPLLVGSLITPARRPDRTPVTTVGWTVAGRLLIVLYILLLPGGGFGQNPLFGVHIHPGGVSLSAHQDAIGVLLAMASLALTGGGALIYWAVHWYRLCQLGRWRRTGKILLASASAWAFLLNSTFLIDVLRHALARVAIGSGPTPSLPESFALLSRVWTINAALTWAAILTFALTLFTVALRVSELRGQQFGPTRGRSSAETPSQEANRLETSGDE